MKSQNIYEFSLTNFSWYIRILRCFIQFQKSNFCFNFLKTDRPKTKNTIPLTFMVGCFSYLRITFKVASLTFSIIGSKSEYWEMLRFFTILPKRFLKTTAVSFQVFTISPFSLKLILSVALNFSDSEGFTVFKKSLLSETFLSSKFSQLAFLVFLNKETQ